MGFFSAPYQVLARDVAGSGQRRYLIEDAFHEGLWLELMEEARALAASASSELDDVEWLVQERYLRVFAPVEVDECVAILLSFEDGPGIATMRVYSRVVRRTGEPVACAWSTFVCTSRCSGDATAIPATFTDYLHARGAFREPTTGRPFPMQALAEEAGESLFPAAVRELGARVAQRQADVEPPRRASLRPTTATHPNGIAGATRQSTALALPGFHDFVAPARGVAFTFPGERSYDGRLLRELHGYLPYLSNHFHQADDVARRFFRQEFLPLVEVETLALHDQRLERCPELAHLGVVLCGILIAETLQEHGIKPEVLVGDGIGELSALVVAGALDVATGLRLAAQRAASLRRQPNGGPPNDPRAWSGPALADVTFATPRLQIFLASEEGLFSPDTDLARALATWLTRAASLDSAVQAVRDAGCEHLIECGPGGILPPPDAAVAPARRDEWASPDYRSNPATVESQAPLLPRPAVREDVRA